MRMRLSSPVRILHDRRALSSPCFLDTPRML
jgi:hypothetical protein